MKDIYEIRDGYTARSEPAYFDDTSEDITWQPDVYSDAADLARALRASTIVDLGCGAGAKLVALSEGFKTVGVDFGINIERCRARYPEHEWLEADFDSRSLFEIREEHAAGALLVCADVLEHLVFPERLVDAIRGALVRGAAAAILTTPDRVLYYGEDHNGPPPNPAHVREWSSEEFSRFLESRGLHPDVGLTRSSTAEFRHRTIFAAIAGPGSESIVAQWMRRRPQTHVPIRLYEEALSDYERQAELSRSESAGLQLELRKARAAGTALESALAELGSELSAAQTVAALRAEQIGWVNRSRWVRLGRRMRISRLPVLGDPSGTTTIHPPVVKPLSRAAVSGGVVLLTRGPREFRGRYKDWREGRQRERTGGVQGVAVKRVAVSARVVEAHLPVDGNHPEITVVIPVWNALEYARDCVRSVADAIGSRSTEIVVVDNGSHPDVSQWLNEEKARIPTLRYLRLAENVGYAAGVNLGCRAARGRFFAILNSDTVVTRGWLDALIGALERDETLGVVSPVTNYVGEGLQIDGEARDITAAEAERYAKRIKDRNEVVYPPERIAFFCVVMRREIFDLLEGFDESFGLGNFEDEDFCLRTQMLGRRLGVVRSSFVYHHGSKTFEANDVAHSEWMRANLDRYVDKVSQISSSRPSQRKSGRPSQSPAISVVTRTRNRPDKLRVALNSLSHQIFSDFEVVVVNDGGEDVSSILQDYEGFLRVKYVWNREGHGQAGALNDGLSAATGDFISYLDDDDIVYPFHLASLFADAAATRSDQPFVYSNFNQALVVRAGLEYVVVERIHRPLWAFDRVDLLVQNRPPQHTWLHTRELALSLGGFDTSFTILQDWDFLLRATEGVSLVPLKRETCEYRIYADMTNSVSGRHVAMADMGLIYEKHPVQAADVERRRKQEFRGLAEQIVELRRLEEEVERGVIPRRLAMQRQLAVIYGFDGAGLTTGVLEQSASVMDGHGSPGATSATRVT